MVCVCLFFVKQKTAYEMRISDWSSDVCSSDLKAVAGDRLAGQTLAKGKHVVVIGGGDTGSDCVGTSNRQGAASVTQFELMPQPPESENKPLVWPYWPLKLRTSSSHEEGCERDWAVTTKLLKGSDGKRSEEHTSELQSLMRISYAVFCLKKKNIQTHG